MFTSLRERDYCWLIGLLLCDHCCLRTTYSGNVANLATMVAFSIVKLTTLPRMVTATASTFCSSHLLAPCLILRIILLLPGKRLCLATSVGTWIPDYWQWCVTLISTGICFCGALNCRSAASNVVANWKRSSSGFVCSWVSNCCNNRSLQSPITNLSHRLSASASSDHWHDNTKRRSSAK